MALRPPGAFLCGMLLLACTGDATDCVQTVYTSISDGKCRAPLPPTAETYRSRDLGVEECEGAGGYRVFLVSSDANSWLDLEWDGKLFSLERDVVYLDPIGLFPNVGGSDRIEWRFDESGRARALIFRVVAQNPEAQNPAGGANLSRLFVVRLNPEINCLLGVVKTNEEARVLADGPGTCPYQKLNPESAAEGGGVGSFGWRGESVRLVRSGTCSLGVDIAGGNSPMPIASYSRSRALPSLWNWWQLSAEPAL